MSERINLLVEDGIGDKLTALAGGERKRGQWLSELVAAMHEQGAQAAAGSELDTLRFGFAGLVAQVKILEGRLQRVEQEIAAGNAAQQ